MKFVIRVTTAHALESRPARGAWVEIREPKPKQKQSQVAPREGRVG